jgi:hypothetical protein
MSASALDNNTLSRTRTLILLQDILLFHITLHIPSYFTKSNLLLSGTLEFALYSKAVIGLLAGIETLCWGSSGCRV